MNCPLPNNPQWSESNARFGSKESFRAFVQNNGEIFDGRNIVANKDGLMFMNALLSNLESRFGIPYSIIPNEEMGDLTGFKTNPPKGFISEGKVYINKDKMSIEAAFHEYLHPVIEMIDVTKPHVIDKFWEDLQSMPEGRDSIAKVMRSEEYRTIGKFDGDVLNREGKKEVIVTLLGKLSEQDFSEMLGVDKLSKPLIQRMKEFIQDIWAELLDFMGLDMNITPETFNEKTSLSFVAQLMALTDLGIDMKSDPEFRNRVRNNMFQSYLTDRELTRAGKIMEEVNIFLERRMQTLQSKPAKLLEIQNVKKDFEAAKNKAEAFQVIVGYAHTQIVGTENKPGYYQKMMDAVKDIQNKDPMEAMQMLQSYHNFAEKFHLLFQRIEEELQANGFSDMDIRNMKSEVGSPMHQIKQILEDSQGIMVTYKNQVLPTLARVLEPFYRNTENDSPIVKELKTRLKLQRDRLQKILEKEKQRGQLGIWDNLTKRSLMNDITKNENLLRKNAPGYKGLLDQLTEASEDIGLLDKFLTPAISQSDPVLSTFAVMIKESMEKVRLGLIDLQNSVVNEFKAYKKATGLGIDNVEKFNEGIYEKIQIYHKGSLVTTYGFVQEFDMNKYTKEYNEVKLLQEKYQREGKYDKAKEVFDNFMSESREPLSRQEIDDIVSQMNDKVKSGEISKSEFNEFIVKNMYNRAVRDNRMTEWKSTSITYEEMYAKEAEDLLRLHREGGKIIYQGQLAKIRADKYRNPRWEELQKNPAKARYHKFLLDKYLEAQEKLPASRRMGHILPGVRKQGFDRLMENGVKNHLVDELTDAVTKVTGRDEETLGVNWGSGNKDTYSQKMLPIYYTSVLPENEVSLDLQRSVLLFSAMADKYAALEKIHPVVQSMEHVAANRKVAKTNSLVTKTVDAFAAALGFQRPQYEDTKNSNLSTLTSAFIDMQVYGEKQLVEEFELLGVKMDFGKMANTLTSLASKRTIGGDFLKAMANMTQAKMMSIVESIGGELVDTKSFLKGEADYITQVAPQVMGDMYKPEPESFHGKLLQVFEPLQGDFMNELGQNVSKSRARKMISWDTWFMGIRAGEHYAQISMFYGMMHKNKIKDGNGNLVPLHKAYELREGRIRLREGFDPSWDIGGENMLKFMEKVHGINKRLHGVYNDFDYVYAQRFGLGRLMIMFRKFAPPGFKRRFKRLGFNNETGMIDEGMYNTWMNELVRKRGNLIKMLFLDKELTPVQKANIRRTNAEITLMLLSGMAIAMLAGEDGDDDGYLANFSEYLAKRLQSELMFYVNPPDFLRILSSPSAATTTIEAAWKAIDQTALTWDPDKLHYKRKQGIWNKGDNKAIAAWVKLLGINGYNLHPEEAVKILDFTR